MSSAKSKAISEIDLEEFERRLRMVRAPQAGVEDPSVGIDTAGQHDRRRAPTNRESCRHRVRADAQVGALPERPSAPERDAGAPASARCAACACARHAARRAACGRSAGCAGRADRARLEARRRTGARDAPKPLCANASRIVRRDAAPRDRDPHSGAEAIAAETHEEETSAHEYLAQALQAGDRINFARPPRRGFVVSESRRTYRGCGADGRRRGGD